MRIAVLSALIVAFLSLGAAEGGTVTLVWDPNSEPDLEGYLLSYGTAPGQYTTTIDVGNVTSYQFSEPNPLVRYYLALRAYNTSGGISPYSNEVATTPASSLTVTGLSSNKMSPQPVGSPIVFSAIAIGGLPPYQFKWWIVNGASSTVGQQWSTSNTFTWTPTSASSNYSIRVWARKAGSTADAPDNVGATLTMTFVITATNPPGGGGTGLAAQYYNDPGTGARFSTLVLTRTDPSVNFTWDNGSPATSVQADDFSVRWTGQVLAPTSGTYRFATTSDDGVRLWVNGQQVINNWTDHAATTDASSAITLTAGTRYDIRLEFYENGGGAMIQLRWTPPGQAESIIPASQLTPVSNPPPPTGTGLRGEYYHDPGTGAHFSTLVLTRTDPSVNFTWGLGSPATSVQIDDFSVRWTGKVLAPTSGTYRFSTTSDDGVRLWVNGQQVIKNWTDHAGTTDASSAITLTAGTRYDIRLEFYENGGNATIQLRWTPPGQPEAVIPTANLSP